MIKPQFWDKLKLAKLSRDARLTYIGLWNFCDDLGVIPADPMYIKSKLFPYDRIQLRQFKSWLSDLAGRGFISLFSHDEEEFYYLPKFQKHQRIDKPNYNELFLGREVTEQLKKKFEDTSTIDQRCVDDASLLKRSREEDTSTIDRRLIDDASCPKKREEEREVEREIEKEKESECEGKNARVRVTPHTPNSFFVLTKKITDGGVNTDLLQTEEEKKEKSCGQKEKKEEVVLSNSDPLSFETQLDRFEKECLQHNLVWQKRMAMALHLGPVQEIQTWISRYFAEMRARDELKTCLSDTKRHCFSWIKIALAKEREQVRKEEQVHQKATGKSFFQTGLSWARVTMTEDA